MAYGIYAPDGTFRTTTVNGLTRVGLYAADGSFNVVVDDASNKGLFHPCGALRVNSGSGVTNHDATGAYYVNHFLGRNSSGVSTTPTGDGSVLFNKNPGIDTGLLALFEDI